jgi:hypothetical protein
MVNPCEVAAAYPKPGPEEDADSAKLTKTGIVW